MRLFRSQPAFALALAATAAAGLAVNTAFFAIVDGPLVRGLAFPRANELVHLELKALDFFELSSRDRGRIAELRQRLTSSATLAGLAWYRVDELVEDEAALSDEWRSLEARQVSHDFFDVLGTRPVLGRTFTAADEFAGPRPVILSHRLWSRRFGNDPGILGRILQLPGTVNRGAAQVVGVMDDRLGFPRGVGVWIVGPRPIAPVGVSLVGRLAAGATLASVRTEFPEMTVMPLDRHMRPPNATMMGYLLVGGVCLCFIAWLHVGSLLLARTVRRMPEFRLKLALGANWRELRLESIGESLVIIGAALLVACALTPALYSLALSQLTADFTTDDSVAVSVRSGVFLVILALLGAAMLSVIPIAVVGALKDAPHMGKETIAGRGTHAFRSFRQAVFVAQVAAATVLVYLTTLVAVSYQRVSSVPLAFEPDGLWTVALPAFESPAKGDVANARAAHRVRLQDTHREIAWRPQVVSVAGASFSPMRRGGIEPALLRAESDPSARAFAGKQAYVTVGFTRTCSIDLIAGREMLPSEAESISDSAMQPGELFALANAALANHLRQFGDPVGQIVVMEPVRRVRVLGVIPDVRFESPDEAPPPMLFMFTKRATSGQQLLMRIQDGESPPHAAVREAMQRSWGRNRFAELNSVERSVANATADYRVRVFVLVIMAVFSIPVTALGLVGAVTHVREERRMEFAIRLALGATPKAIERLLLRYFLGLGALGLAAGATGAAILGQAMAAVLFGVSSTDPQIGGFVVALMTVMLVAAVAIPTAAARSNDLSHVLKA